MRDEGLDEAIRAAGGIGALARKIGISQPSVSNWSRIPQSSLDRGRNDCLGWLEIVHLFEHRGTL